MWPFKRKEKNRDPRTDFEYFLLGIAHGQELRRKYPQPKAPKHTPSKIIQPKQLK